MTPLFPATVWSPTALDLDTDVTQDEWQRHVVEIAALEQTVGVNPQGSAVSVAARLQTIEDLVTILGGAQLINLRVVNGATPASQIGITADAIGIEGSLVTTLSVTADITVAGLNGLSTGSEAASTWYFVWVGYNPTTMQRGATLSTSATRAGLNLAHASFAGFIKWRRVGARRNDGTSNLMRGMQVDRLFLYEEDIPGTTGIVSSGTSSTGNNAVSAAGFIPTTSRLGRFHCALRGATTAVNLRLRPNGAPSYQTVTEVSVLAGDVSRATVDIGLDSTQQIQWTNSGAGVGSPTDIAVVGYWDGV